MRSLLAAKAVLQTHFNPPRVGALRRPRDGFDLPRQQRQIGRATDRRRTAARYGMFIKLTNCVPQAKATDGQLARRGASATIDCSLAWEEGAKTWWHAQHPRLCVAGKPATRGDSCKFLVSVIATWPLCPEVKGMNATTFIPFTFYSENGTFLIDRAYMPVDKDAPGCAVTPLLGACCNLQREPSDEEK
ncbi:hypothetical protein [Paraburkholderia kirstenboschensis]|uniref:hypothetical protein n=1 Tax=Paraburkholderia kirstenboschensis TaxID=1245436 RepID=UPI000FFBA0E2|nr:hypothetical protein [Paraburkholderia kirstenboschensis]